MSRRPADLAPKDPESLLPSKGSGPRVQPPTCFPSPASHSPAPKVCLHLCPLQARPFGSDLPSCPAPGQPCPAPAPLGLPEVGQLQRVQRRFIKALHGVAAPAASDGRRAGLRSRAPPVPQATSGSGPRRKCWQAPGGGRQRAGAARRGDARAVAGAGSGGGAGAHVTYRPGFRDVRPSRSGLRSKSRPGE